MIIWIIGLSSSGKTTIGKKLFSRLKDYEGKWVFLDGDDFRKMMGEDLGHTVEDRRRNAVRMTNLCKFLDSYGISAVVCILSLFHDNQRSNRKTFSEYREAYIDVKMEKLAQRDNKDMYKKALEGKIKNVVGVDIPFNPPSSPDIIIDNNEDNPDFDSIANRIILSFGLRKKIRGSNKNQPQ